MPEAKKTATKKLRALTGLNLRKSPDPNDPLYQQEWRWEAGEVFEPPAHMNVAKALERGIAEEVD